MWTKDELWQTLINISGIVLIFIAVLFYFQYGLVSVFFFVPIAVFGFVTKRLFSRTLKVSREQVMQFSRHVDELSHHLEEKERLNKIVRRSEERFRSAYDNASIGMAIVSKHGSIQSVNEALAETLGFSGENIVGHNFQEYLHSEDLNSFLLLSNSLIEGTNTSVQLECRVHNSKDETLWLLWNASFVSDEDESSEESHFIFQLRHHGPQTCRGTP